MINPESVKRYELYHYTDYARMEEDADGTFVMVETCNTLLTRCEKAETAARELRKRLSQVTSHRDIVSRTMVRNTKWLGDL